jgi:hypothetical protein
VREHSIEKLTGNTIAIQWNKSVDNRAVKSYMVRANGEVIGTPSVNALYITNLTPETLYNFTITAVDFNNNLSYPYAFSLQTLGYPSINQRIEAEAYTSQSGVEFQTTTDTGGGSNAGWLDRDDYLEYLISIPLEGSYTLSARVASQSAAGQLAILADNSLKTTMTLPITGGWQTWQTATSTPFTLPAGVVRLSLRVAAPGFNLNYLTIQPA